MSIKNNQVYRKLLFSLLIFLACERPHDVIQADQQKYERISKERTIGTPCSENDTANIKRRNSHPLGPTGGWYGESSMDISRTSEQHINTFRRLGTELSGFVKFPTEGVLQARSYDNTYGSVYCGWSPNKITYTPKSAGIHVSINLCIVGDGGLAQVTEVCWFPKGESVGRIIYTDAHPTSDRPPEHLLYTDKQIGQFIQLRDQKIYRYHQHQAEEIFRSLLIARKKEEAHKLVLNTLNNFEHLEGAIRGDDGSSIPPKQFHCDAWRALLLMKAGLELKSPSSTVSLKQADEILQNHSERCRRSYSKDLLPYYQWLTKSVQGEKLPLPQPPTDAQKVHGYDPRVINRILSETKILDSDFGQKRFILGEQSNYFWLGAKAYLQKDAVVARSYIEKYLQDPNNSENEFELGASLALLSLIDDNSFAE